MCQRAEASCKVCTPAPPLLCLQPMFTASLPVLSQIPGCSGCGNGEGGVFSALVDGVTLATMSFGSINNGETQRGLLSFTSDLHAGTHDLEILITRTSQNHSCILGTPNCSDITFGDTPFQFVTDITLEKCSDDRCTITPPPMGVPIERKIPLRADEGENFPRVLLQWR